MSELKIISDFQDYYDRLTNESSLVTYRRFLSECKQRGGALGYLRSIGIKTVSLKQVDKFNDYDRHLVVYTNPMLHNGDGKQVMGVREAKQRFSNYVASRYEIASDPLTIKYLQVGKRRFKLCYRKREQITLDMGDLLDIKELPSEYNRLLALPIYSIDYIPCNNEMLAVDFNEVQNLGMLGLEEFLPAEEVIQELRESIIIYNKA